MGHYRVEITCFEEKLFRKKIFWRGEDKESLVYCTESVDALNPPFPAEGKSGISILVGSLASLREPKVRMLWELERRRGRPSLVIVTRLKGKRFLSSVQEVEVALGSSRISPVGFLRRRGNVWDVLDFYSGGDSDAFKQAKLRLRRLKQAGWELLVDRAAAVDDQLRGSYFETLDTQREQVRESVRRGFHGLQLSPMLGVAGECLNADHWDSLLETGLVKSLLECTRPLPAEPAVENQWTLLGKRGLGRELLLLGSSQSGLRPGQIFRSVTPALESGSEFAVAKIRDSLVDEKLGTRAVRVEVDWRYPPEREIATNWHGEYSALAGSSVVDG